MLYIHLFPTWTITTPHEQSGLNKILSLLWVGNWTGWYLKVFSSMNCSMILCSYLCFYAEANSSLLKCIILSQGPCTDMFIIKDYYSLILKRDFKGELACTGMGYLF